MNIFTLLKKNRWMFVVIIVIILLIIPFLLFMIKGSASQNSTTTSSTSIGGLSDFFSHVFPTPTPFEMTPLSILSTFPADQDTDINPEAAITVTFSRPLSQSEQSKIALRISPNASGSASWSQDKTTFTFTPSFPFLEYASYAATIIFDSTSSPWSFTTGSLISQTQGDIDARQNQTILDNHWAQDQQSIENSFPWVNSLPLSADTYFVTFDVSSKKFLANLYFAESNPNQDIENTKKDILSQLANLGVDLKKYPIVWNITVITPTPAP